MKIRLLTLAALLISGLATAGDISPVVGHYRYKDYAATFADGRVIKLQDMGATDAFLVSPRRGDHVAHDDGSGKSHCPVGQGTRSPLRRR